MLIFLIHELYGRIYYAVLNYRLTFPMDVMCLRGKKSDMADIGATQVSIIVRKEIFLLLNI